MLRSALAHLLHALADRIEPEKPEVEVQYVYVYSASPAWPTPYVPGTPWVAPFQSPNICSTN